MWNAENVSAAATSVMALGTVITLVLTRVEKMESLKKNRQHTETEADTTARAAAHTISLKARLRIWVPVMSLLCGLASLSFVQFGPLSDMPLTAGVAAGIGLSLGLVWYGMAALMR